MDATLALLHRSGGAVGGRVGHAAGEFGSVWGYLYQGCGNVAECLVFGRIAARSVLGIA